MATAQAPAHGDKQTNCAGGTGLSLGSEVLIPNSMARWLSSDFCLVAILIAINLACFYRTLGGYFLADDFVHVAYLSQVFHGHPDWIWQNFFTNWMQTEGTQFYRPFITLTLAFDYWLWGANPFGFHLSNTFYQAASSVFLFLSCRRLLREFGGTQSTLAAFFAAALFATYPLHPEVVSWVIGRVDSVCVAFLLLSLWLFLKAEQDGSLWAKLAASGAFAISLLSKEMAVTLPATLTIYFIISANSQNSLRERIVLAIKKTWLSWALLTCYLLIRTAALGTFTGGYTGSIGEGLTGSLVKRWFLDGSFQTVLFPFNAELFWAHDRLRGILRAIYVLAGMSLVVRLLAPAIVSGSKSGASRYILFAGAWFVISMLPTYQVWNLTQNLQGSRFIYLGSAPLCLLLVLLIFPLWSTAVKYTKWEKLTGIVGCSLLVLTVLTWGSITYRNNLPWAHAGAQVRNLRSQIEQVLTTLAANQKLAILNLPQRIQGAHMIYNAAMLSVLLSPPLSSENLSGRVISFEPMTYGDSDLLVISRVRKMLSNSQAYYFVSWDQLTQKLRPLHLVLPDSSKPFLKSLDGFSAHNLTEQDLLVSPVLNVPSTTVDFVDVDLSAAGGSLTAGNERTPQYLSLSWAHYPDSIFLPSTHLVKPLIVDGMVHHYRFAVSEHKSWVMAQNINRIALQVPSGSLSYDLKRVTLSNGYDQMPQLLADTRTFWEGPDGVSRLNGSSGTFAYDASMIPGVQQVVAEMTSPNAWFEHYSGDFRDQELSRHSLKTWTVGGPRGSFELNVGSLPIAAYYQLRIAALGADGKVVGYVSDPINLQISGEQILASKKNLPALKAN